MKLFTSCLFVVLSINYALPAQAKNLAYVDWSRSMNDDPKYSGYKAFDDQKKTAWCSGPDGVSDQLTAGFLGDQIVDEIGIIVGAVDKNGALDQSRARVRELRVSDGLTQQVLRFADKPGLQFVRINPALNAQRMTFTVEKVFLVSGALPLSASAVLFCANPVANLMAPKLPHAFVALNPTNRPCCICGLIRQAHLNAI